MNPIYIHGKRFKLTPAQVIGKGTEADVFQLEPGRAVKVFKGSNHPDLELDPQGQQAAASKIQEHQTKLPAFPKGLPDRVITPEELVTDKPQGNITGYTMRMVEAAQRLKGYTPERTTATRLLLDLRQSVEALHSAGIVIGDFTPMNLLAKGGQVFLIDTDSFQFGKFPCRMFTENYVDPLLCDPTHNRPILVQPHSTAGDWFAYAVIMMELMLGVTPYHGGVYKGKGVPPYMRPLKRITVFHPEVVYPRQALHFKVLSDELLHYFVQTFEKDMRFPAPAELLNRLQWQTCQCGLQHARTVCPNCGPKHGPVVLPLGQVTRGDLRATILFRTPGEIFETVFQLGELRIVYIQNAQLYAGTLEQAHPVAAHTVRFFQGNTMAVQRDTVQLPGVKGLQIVEPVQGEPQIAAGEKYAFWAQNGYLWQFDGIRTRQVCEVLRGQTSLWANDVMGLAYFHAGQVRQMFLFFPNQGVTLPCPDPGVGNAELLQMNVILGGDRAVWIFFLLKTNHRLVQRLLVLDGTGRELHRSETEEIREGVAGACASPTALFVPTDEGIRRIDGSSFQERLFPQTADFVDSSTRLLLFHRGIYAVAKQTITELLLN